MKLALRIAAVLLVCVAPAVVAQDVKFTAGETVRDIPFRHPNNLIVVEASINNGPKAWFIFDTGAESTVVDSKYSASAGLKASSKTVGTGSAGTAVAGVIKGTTFRLGGLETRDLTVYALPLDFIKSGLGLPLAGIIGNDIIGKTVAEIDYANLRLTLYSPAAFRPPANADILPITMQENLPFVTTNIHFARRVIPAKMEIDTGSTGALLFNGPFVRKHRLTALVGSSLGSRTGGVGGSGTARLGRATAVQFGKTLVKEPLAQLYTGTKGDNASDRYDGLIGGAIYRRFKMTIDIPGKRLFLEPGTGVEEPFDTDMSGMDLLADGPALDKILVDEVKPNSVAAKAGVRGGEMVRSVNGRAASELGIQEVRRILRTAGEVDIELTRGRRVFTVHLILKRVI